MENLNQLTVKELKQICRDENHRGFSKLRKAELVEHIIESREAKEQNRVDQENAIWGAKEDIAQDSNMTEDEFDREMFANSIYADRYDSYEEWKAEEERQHLENCFNLPTHVYDAREIDTEVKKINDLMQRQQLERDEDELDEEELKLCQQFVDELIRNNPCDDDLPF